MGWAYDFVERNNATHFEWVILKVSNESSRQLYGTSKKSFSNLCFAFAARRFFNSGKHEVHMFDYPVDKKPLFSSIFNICAQKLFLRVGNSARCSRQIELA